jgi:hypothetical protein
MKWPTSRILVLLALSPPALAHEDAPPTESEAEAASAPAAPSPPRPFDPPHVDYPGIQALGPGISLYLDTTYETTSDLSTFWWVQGRGTNYRLSVGGTYQAGGLRLNAEVPVQYTELAIDLLMKQAPAAPDRTKAAVSLGDVITGAAYFWELPTGSVSASAGLGLRVRWPTHTTRFQFGLVDGSILEFGFPYYLHVAPGALLSASWGPVSVLVNQGVLAMLAKDVTLGDVLQRIPNLYFWESHVAGGVDATDWLLLSVEMVSFVQLNRVEVSNMTNLNDTRAVFVSPGVGLATGQLRLAVAGRFGLTGRSARDFGVITFSGTHAVVARVSYVF